MEKKSLSPVKGFTSAATTFGHIEKGICYAALILMALLPVTDALLRLISMVLVALSHGADASARPFKIVIPYSKAFLIHLFLIAGLFAAMLTTQAKEHISIAIIQYAKKEKFKKILSFISGLISTFVATVLFWDSLSFFVSYPQTRMIGFIPEKFFVFVMCIAYGIIAIRFALYSTTALETKKWNWLVILSLLLAIAAALPAITKLIWGFESPKIFNGPLDFLYNASFYAKTPLILFLVVAALAGTPIFVAIGGIALIMLQSGSLYVGPDALLWGNGGEPEVAPNQIFSALTNYDIIAIPLFTLTGFFLSESKAGTRLVAAFRSLFAWLPGGMIIATVVICAFFTSFTGASGVTILALGGILYTILKEKLGYSEKFSVGLLTSVGCIGLLFPPSLPIILVGSTTNNILYFMGEPVNYNIISFFLGGIIPGIILVLAMIVFGIVASIKVKIPVERFNLKDAGSAIKGSIFEILLPFVLISGYFSGILSLVEVSAVSVIYVFIIEVFVTRDIALKDVPKVFYKAVPIIGGILSILAMAKALSYAIVDTQVPQHFAEWMQHTIESKYVFLLLLNVALLILGCVMDIFSAILVVLPLIVPLGQVYGIDPIHLGIIFIINLEVGFLTPPVGINLLLSSYRFNKPFVDICRYVFPFLLIQLIVVLLVTYVPVLSTWLPRLF